MEEMVLPTELQTLKAKLFLYGICSYVCCYFAYSMLIYSENNPNHIISRAIVVVADACSGGFMVGTNMLTSTRLLVYYTCMYPFTGSDFFLTPGESLK